LDSGTGTYSAWAEEAGTGHLLGFKRGDMAFTLCTAGFMVSRQRWLEVSPEKPKARKLHFPVLVYFW
jgi:hypothetical protein